MPAKLLDFPDGTISWQFAIHFTASISTSVFLRGISEPASGPTIKDCGPSSREEVVLEISSLYEGVIGELHFQATAKLRGESHLLDNAV
jgi:hypothetical protein